MADKIIRPIIYPLDNLPPAVDKSNPVPESPASKFGITGNEKTFKQVIIGNGGSDKSSKSVIDTITDTLTPDES